MNRSCSSQICSCLQLSYRLSSRLKLYYCIYTQLEVKGHCVVRELGRASPHQDAFFELAWEFREAKFYRQVASRLIQREKVRLDTVQSPKLLGRQFHRDTCRRSETGVAS